MTVGPLGLPAAVMIWRPRLVGGVASPVQVSSGTLGRPRLRAPCSATAALGGRPWPGREASIDEVDRSSDSKV